jgi:dolichol-phosphate mannosyltransferase
MTRVGRSRFSSRRTAVFDGLGPRHPSARAMPRLSVIFSFRNEEHNIRELVRRTRSVLDAEVRKNVLSSYELIFVNDASTDRSLELLRAAAQGADDIRVVNMSRSFGVSPCVLAGMEVVSGDVVVYMDADLQDPPEAIPDLLRVWTDNPGVEIVHSVRRSRAGESRIKLWITALGYRILRLISSVEIPIDTGDFKLLSRRAVNELVRLREKKPFLRGMVSWIGFRQDRIYYDREPRFAGETKFPVLGIKVIRNFLESALISFSGVPLQISTLLGFLMSLSAFALFVHVLVERLRGHNIPGWTAIMTAILFLGGIQLLMLGVIGLYLHAMYVELKDRPNYIIESSFAFGPAKEIRPPAQNESGQMEPGSRRAA